MSFEEKAFLALVRRLNDLENLAEDGQMVGVQIEIIRGLLRELRKVLRNKQREQQQQTPGATGPELVWSK